MSEKKGFQTFAIKREDGSLEGPYSVRVIKAMIVAKKLSGKEFLLTPEGEVSIAEHPEFSSLFQRLRGKGSKKKKIKKGKVVLFRGQVLPPGPGVTYAGTFSKYSPVHLLYRLYLASETGRLHIRNNRDTVDIFLEDGLPVYAASNDEKTRLGELLVRREFISRSELTTALKLQEKTGQVLGKILLKLRSISREKLEKALLLQFEERIFKIFGWRRNTIYRFYRDQVTGQEFPFQVEFLLLLKRGVMEKMPWAIVNEALLPYSNRRVVRLIHPKIKLEDLKLTKDERAFYQTITHRDPLRDVIGNAVEKKLLGEEVAQKLVFLLWQIELLRFDEEILGERTARQLRELDEFIQKLQNQSRLERLGLTSGASPEEIRRAYLKLAKKYHPDNLPPGTHPKVAEKMNQAFALIAEAYRVLSK